MWPKSPAQPWAPRWRRPPTMSPLPIPVPILTKITSSTPFATPPQCSPVAITLTSLSTKTGAAYSPANAPRIGKRSQPGMIGGTVNRPDACSTGPGTPTPIASTSLGLAACSSISSDRRVFTRSRTAIGPCLTSAGSPRWAISSLPSVVRATSMDVAPISTAAISPAEGGMTSRDERRPPSDSARPSSANSPFSMSRATSDDILPRLELNASVSRALEIDPSTALTQAMISAWTLSSTKG